MKRLSIITLSFFLLTTVYVFSISKIVSFGDSLTCTGNACMYSLNPDVSCLIYPQGRFTDGDIWIEILAEKLKISKPIPSLIGGFNFAYGGAMTGWKESSNILNVGNQIKEFLNRSNYQADPDSLYIIWAGANDIKNKIIPLKLISNLENHIRELAKSGAKTFLVPNFPPLSKTPIAKDSISFWGRNLGEFGEFFELLDDGSSFYKRINSFANKFTENGIEFMNYRLKRTLKNLQKSLGITIYQLDTYTYFSEVMQNPTQYGLDSIDKLFLYDGFHPSSFGHHLIAEAAFEELGKKF